MSLSLSKVNFIVGQCGWISEQTDSFCKSLQYRN